MVALSNAPAITLAPIPPLGSTGFSFSPGGLLFPYHLGVITSLEHHGRLTDSVHLAGASAGAIAVASHAAKTPSAHALDAAFRVCDQCETQFDGRAIGKLLPLLKAELEMTFSPDAHTVINEREGVTALAHRELFPNNRPVLTTKFDTRDDLIEAVCDSSMFPFFSTPFPVRLRYKEGERIPRVVVDGFFSVPRERYGCPDFAHLNFDSCVEEKLRRMGGVLVDENGKGNVQCNSNEYDEMPVIERTITVACFPHETVGLTASLRHDQISPEPDYANPVGQMSKLFQYATQPSSRKELEALYEKGWADAERWSYEEDLRERELTEKWLKERRLHDEVEGAIRMGDLL
eukprot:CAMPEP_0172535862 /NCGR_PEP_ID=MMETSP1067-20121228/7694_1 /TAXON_ID=265564 ORGANISM="Thalassiosira punctigera, Strain Tpunct2005C2" /NCGR_SAMPLE_ID=MMETSP1067 /ASSEMBLY_ACC=CAM_ASM_000444 /LENGTH=346 /DNA_ID=CAMNT_0013320821 /DNA_START=104 /DNA_END=1144 /DNA_ORIENTATION=+